MTSPIDMEGKDREGQDREGKGVYEEREQQAEMNAIN